MLRPLRLAHTSDVHLDGEASGAEARQAFVRAIHAVAASGADLFLIAGDLFDHNRVEGRVIDFALTQLQRIPCPTVVIAGNHDCWNEASVLRRTDFSQAGAHVSLLREPDGARLEFPALHASVWGRCMLDHVPEYRPLAGAPPRLRDLWHIGMAHGLYAEDPDTPRSSLITPAEIETAEFDYLALGHVHAHRQMRHGATLACYPGVPADGLTLVDLVPGQPAQAVTQPLP